MGHSSEQEKRSRDLPESRQNVSDAHKHLRIVTRRQPGFSLQKERGKKERGREGEGKEGMKRGGRIEGEREREEGKEEGR